MKITAQEIEDIAVGAAVLGTGGGGDPFIGKLLALDAVARYGPVELIQPEEVADDGLVVPSAGIGAPTVLVEKIPNGEEGLSALRILEERIRRKAVAITPIEQGGLNSEIPISVAAKTRLPMTDCDGIGRAFPELQMCSFNLDGIPANPMILADEKGNVVLLETIDNLWMERFARSAVVQMGGSALSVAYPLTGAQLKKSCIKGTVSLSLRLGEITRLAREKGENPFEDIVKILKSRVLFKGKLVDIFRRTTGGFARGEALFSGLDEFDGESLRIKFQNENLIALHNEKKIVATVPDLISVLDLETGMAITTEELRYGNRVVIIGSPCNERWRTPKGIAVAGPKYFGYDVDYVPVEELGA
jgi:uncharacterized protein